MRFSIPIRIENMILNWNRIQNVIESSASAGEGANHNRTGEAIWETVGGTVSTHFLAKGLGGTDLARVPASPKGPARKPRGISPLCLCKGLRAASARGKARCQEDNHGEGTRPRTRPRGKARGRRARREAAGQGARPVRMAFSIPTRIENVILNSHRIENVIFNSNPN